MSATDSDTFASSFNESKYGHGRSMSIVRSTSASVSLVASLLLVWILNRSRSRFAKTYHRLVLGMSAADILMSSGLVTYGLISPADLNYMIWNARGNLATCDAFGFLHILGASASPLYCASLNLYYLAQIKYNMPDSYITRKLEPLLHAVPTLYGLIVSIIVVAQEGINDDNGACASVPYNPPHCDGFEDGQVPDGFKIACGRGNSLYQSTGIIVLGIVVAFMILLAVPISMIGSLFMIYRSISRGERRMRRYGERAFERPQPTSDTAAQGNDEGQNNRVTSGSSVLSSLRSTVRSRFGRGNRPRIQGSSQSRAVAHRAAAYSISYFVTWIWTIIYLVSSLAGAWPTEIPLPTWTIAFNYSWIFFNPLQGLWTLLIYMHPRVANAKESADRDISWVSAFFDALWFAATGRKRSPLCRTRKRGGATPGTIDGTHPIEGTAETS